MSIQLTLERDGHDQPWGFRLQGGVDVGLPLSVLRVLVGTSSDSVLKKGDIVTKISQTGTHNLTHQQAVDLFNSAGNQIQVTIKRSGSGSTPRPSSQPTVSALQATASIRQQQQHPVVLQQSASICESPPVAALPRTTFVLKSDLPPVFAAPTTGGPDDLSVTHQPYRTLPLVQPSAKILNEIGAGSYSHLRLQEEFCTGVREPQLVPVTPSQVNAIKANEFLMKQKTQQGLVNAASDHQRTAARSPVLISGPIPGPVPVKLPPSPSLPPPVSPPVKAHAPQPAKYNTAAGLHGKEAKRPSTGMINPTRASCSGSQTSVALSSNKDYNPTQSATWKLLLESENPPDLDRLKNTSFGIDMNEHDPIFAEVYAAPKGPAQGQKPVRPAFSNNTGLNPSGGVNAIRNCNTPAKAGSPRLGTPPTMFSPAGGRVNPAEEGQSQVAVAAATQQTPYSRGRPFRDEPIPLYETNSIGGRRRIAQSSSFNKLMFNMLGE